MAKKSGIGLVILGGVIVVGAWWLLTRKSREQIDCENAGRVWVQETKICLPQLPEIPPEIEFISPPDIQFQPTFP